MEECMEITQKGEPRSCREILVQCKDRTESNVIEIYFTQESRCPLVGHQDQRADGRPGWTLSSKQPAVHYIIVFISANADSFMNCFNTQTEKGTANLYEESQNIEH